MADGALPPVLGAIDADLDAAAFKAGVARGMWRLVEAQFPFYIFAVTEHGSEDQNKEHFFRFELNGFPAAAPWVQIWDCARGIELPAPERPQRTGVQRDCFKQWTNPNAVYRPWDRISGAHNCWNTQYPDLAWHPGRNLSFVLHDLHQILNREGT